MKRIVIIDDDEAFCWMIKLGLEKTGKYWVATATRGDEGIFIAKFGRPDLILLDIVIPGMSGREIAKHLLKSEYTKNIPIVFITDIVKASEIEENDGFIWGRAFITKPVIIDNIINKIESILFDGSLCGNQEDSNRMEKIISDSEEPFLQVQPFVMEDVEKE